jgi:hypothetical protein
MPHWAYVRLTQAGEDLAQNLPTAFGTGTRRSYRPVPLERRVAMRTPPGSRPQNGVVPTPLLETKLYVPRPRRSLVSVAHGRGGHGQEHEGDAGRLNDLGEEGR